MTTAISIFGWIVLGLPIACACLLLSAGLRVADAGGTRRFWRAAVITVAAILLPFVGFAALSGAMPQAAATCNVTVLTPDPVCDILGRLLLYGGFVAAVALILGAIGGVFAALRWPRALR